MSVPTLLAGKVVVDAAKGVGRLGGAAHRATVAERASALESEGHTITAGGGQLPERSVSRQRAAAVSRTSQLATQVAVHTVRVLDARPALKLPLGGFQ